MYLSVKENYLSQQVPAVTRFHVESLYRQGTSDINEDRLLIKDEVFGVFDGATSLGGRRHAGGMTGGALAAEIAMQSFSNVEGSLHAEMCRANDAIRCAQEDAGCEPPERHQLWSTSAAVVRVGEDVIDFCQTGDSLIMFLLEDGNCRLATPEIDHDRETMVLWKKLNKQRGCFTGSVYDELQDQIRKVRCQMNRTYGVLNGEPEAENFISSGREELGSVTDIILFTDGLYLPKEDPSQPVNWQEFASIYRQGGLQAVHETVRSMQASDPECTVYPRFKCHDDIAAIGISLR